MDATPPIPRAIWNLIDELLNGSIAEEDRARLDEYLTQNESARDFFTTYCQLHVDVVMDQHSEHVMRTFLTAQSAIPVPLAAICERASEGTLAPVQTTTTVAVQKRPSRRRRLLPHAFWSAACLLIVAAVFWRHRDTASTSGPPTVSNVVMGDKRVTLAIANVGTVLLEDSADFSLIAPKRARLTRGRMKMQVTQVSGHGFVVETPYGEVVDNGTEFGLDVDEKGKSSCVVVFDGSVDLNLKGSAQNPADSPSQRLIVGEGAVFYGGGRTDRVKSICSGPGATFRRDADASNSIITEVSDNLDSADTKKFYDIVAGGLHEDAVAYVDRPHEWNGVTADGIPKYLLNADYVRTFSDDRILKKLKVDDRILKTIEIKVTLARPATLYVFSDKRFKQPRWLQKDFIRTTDVMGMDIGRWGTNKKRVNEVGPGKSINVKFDVWKREVREPSVVVLGPPFDSGRSDLGGMYGIAATPLDAAAATKDTKTAEAN